DNSFVSGINFLRLLESELDAIGLPLNGLSPSQDEASYNLSVDFFQGPVHPARVHESEGRFSDVVEDIEAEVQVEAAALSTAGRGLSAGDGGWPVDRPVLDVAGQMAEDARQVPDGLPPSSPEPSVQQRRPEADVLMPPAAVVSPVKRRRPEADVPLPDQRLQSITMLREAAGQSGAEGLLEVLRRLDQA
ncbi:unnamed protein product, partial [Symbiodinium sp. KB8]